MGKVRTIRIKAKLDGSGMVNYEGAGTSGYKSKVSKAYNYSVSEVRTKEKKQAENFSFGKHIYEKKVAKDQEGKEYDTLEGKVIITSNSLRHAIFEESMPFVNKSNILSNADIAEEIGHPAYILRGFVFTSAKADEESTEKVGEKSADTDSEIVEEKGKKAKKKDDSKPAKTNVTTTRGRVLTVTHAVQLNNSVPILHASSSSGGKDNTSLFSKETIGDITYGFKDSLNLKELMFMEMSEENGRLSLHPDHVDLFIESFKRNTGLTIAKSQIGYYRLKGQVGKYTRYGILFNKEQVNYLIKYFLKQVSQINIQRNNGYATVCFMEYLEIIDPCLISQRWDSDSFKPLYSFEEIEALDFDVEDFFVKVE